MTKTFQKITTHFLHKKLFLSTAARDARTKSRVGVEPAHLPLGASAEVLGQRKTRTDGGAGQQRQTAGHQQRQTDTGCAVCGSDVYGDYYYHEVLRLPVLLLLR